MRIQVGGLSDGVYQFTLSADASVLGLDGNFDDQVIVKATIEKNGTQTFLSAAISVQGRFECDRCLTPFQSPLTSSYRMYYVTEEGADSHIDPAELQVVPPGSSVIDLTEDVRQTVMLSVPLKLLCSESCKGLCPYCGTNLNSGTCNCEEGEIDSRWEQLMQLKKRT
ncbi:MAG: DUF177 domain-containing protein [Bacteroidota bacterium]